MYERFRCYVVNLLLVTGIFIFHFACDWRVNVTGIFLCKTFFYENVLLSLNVYE